MVYNRNIAVAVTADPRITMDIAERFSAAQRMHVGTIRSFVNRFHAQMGSHMGKEDLEQELLMVMWECVLKYDPNKGAKFNTLLHRSCNNRCITLVRFFAAKCRAGDVTSLDEDAVAYVVDRLLSSPSAEDRALTIMEVRERLSPPAREQLDALVA